MEKPRMRVAVDAMGGDHGPEVIVEGALAACQEADCDVILVGKEGKVRRLIREMGMPERRPRVVNAEQSVGMDENPKASLRKTNSSISIAAELVKKGEADAFVSMGNTGACLAATVLKWRPLPGVSRPALAQVMPVPGHPVLLLDVGANVDCRTRHLVDFAIMGSIYAQEIFGRPKPRIGVLSIGEEEIKGNELTLGVLKELRKTSLNLLGNAEGRDVFSGKFDVIVCDGFVGNVVLKFGEALAKMIMDHLKGEISKNVLTSLAGLAIAPQLRQFKRQVAPDEFGGAPLLGINGVAIIGHGSSGPRAVTNAIMMAGRVAEKRVNEKVVAAIAEQHQHLGDLISAKQPVSS
jgi:glycerol-3-phosphate acyltransferase PlsX